MTGVHGLLTAVEPCLAAVVTAGQALGLAPRELLHAGPPLTDPRRPPPAIASSVVINCLLEGWARDEAEAEQLLRAGRLTLSPAQDRGCVTPLAAVVSAGTPLLEVRDARERTRVMYSVLSTVRGSDTRMGSRDPTLLSRLRQRDEKIAPALQRQLDERGPIPLWPLAVKGMAGGDDLHNRTSSANEALVLLLRERGAALLADDVAATPLFFLTLWMAACALLLRAAEGADRPTLVTRAGGNGERFGICLAGRAGQWISCEASAPRGPFIAQLPADTRLSGAMGDSAVIDMLGLGGQRLGFAPEPLQLLEDFLPAPAAQLAGRARALLVAPHPQLPEAWPLGLDAAAVAGDASAPGSTGAAGDAAVPLVLLAMLAEDGVAGFVGRGIYQPPLALFERAVAASAGPGATAQPVFDLEPLFAPRSVAVIGASAQGGRATGAVRNLQGLGFAGPIYPVNPKYAEVLGLPCYPDLMAIPGPVDLLCIGIPSEQIPPVLLQAQRKGVRAIVIFASGYAEAGQRGLALQRDLEAFAQANGIAVCGPNCLGVLDFNARACGYSSTSPVAVAPGDVALLSQSGTIVVAMVRSLRGIGFSKMVSSGNEAVVNSADYIRHFVRDPATRVIAAYLESIKEPARFVEVAQQALAAGKPLIVVKSGRSEGGAAASAAHTGALAGSYEVQSAVFRQSGIVHCADLDEFSEAIEMFRVSRRVPAGAGIGMFGISGGENALVMDHAAALGLEIRPLTEPGREKLKRLLPWYGRPENPIDPTGASLDDPEAFIRCIEVLAEEPHLDLIVVSQDSPAAFDLTIARHTVAAARRIAKPIVFFNNFSGPWNPEIIAMLREAGVPYLQGIRESLLAIKAFIDYHALRRQRMAAPAVAPRSAARDLARAEARAMLARAGDAVMTEDASKQLLALYGLPVTTERVVHDAAGALAAASAIGYPVVAKVVSPDLPHKAAAGGVRLNLRTPEALRDAHADLLRAVAAHSPGARIDGVLLQPMVPSGIELILGVQRDPQFGAMLMFGLGGVFVEALAQVALAPAPLTHREAGAMLAQVPAFGRLLDKFHPGSDARELVVALLLQLSDLACDVGEAIEAIDINPVILDAAAGKATIVDALVVRRPPSLH